MTIDEDEEPVVEELTVDEDKVAQLQEPVSIAQRKQRRSRKQRMPKKKQTKRAKIKALVKKLEAADENADMQDAEDSARKR